MNVPTPAPAGDPSPVRVKSVAPGRPLTVVFCGPVLGIMTHWHQGQSWACQGPSECPAPVHRARTLWKGYAACRWWQAVPQRWRADVLEVTEALEEQLRPHHLAGQCWILTRDPDRKKSGQVSGAYLERVVDPELVRPFEILPTLQRIYPNQVLNLGAANPLPPKTLLPEIAGRAPALPGVERLATDAAPTDADRSKVRAMLAEARRTLGVSPHGRNAGKNGA